MAAVSFLKAAMRKIAAWTAPRLASALPDSIHQTAYLAGGARRVVDTAVIELLERGLVRVNRAGEVAGLAAVADDPVHAALLRTLASGPVPHTQLRKVVGKDSSVHLIAEGLESAGFLVPQRSVRQYGRMAAFLYSVVLLFGLGRLAEGLYHDRPVKGLLVLLALTGYLVYRHWCPRMPVATGSTARGVRRLRRDARRFTKRRRKHVGGRLVWGSALTVALLGSDGMADPVLRIALFGNDPRKSDGMGSGCSSCGSGDGSCGGCGD
ncbi:TIGR04222 domain-containing membrane protein [Streptomyces sp. NPDC007355]|uniref:TIGR04222 domain-containing membrane protein n=1 Tax=Streptomyces sp. NPDC007355 TaxID=3364778 RepID=UPI0036B9B17C